MNFVVVILKVGLWNEELYLRIRNIIFSSTDDAYPVPIINYGPLSGSLPNDKCLFNKTKYFRNGGLDVDLQ